MQIRRLGDGESGVVRDVVSRSFRASYAVSPAAIETILDESFAADDLEDRRQHSSVRTLVAERDGSIVGYAEGRLRDETGVLRWLHVAPPARGHGVGSRLFEGLSDRLRADGAERLGVHLLADNAEGEEFVRRFGFSRADHTTVAFGDLELVTRVYTSSPTPAASEPPDTITVDGDQLTVDRDEPVPGVDAVFYPAYREANGNRRRYAFVCGHCTTVVEAVDELERIECRTCGNVHRPDEWDSAYL